MRKDAPKNLTRKWIKISTSGIFSPKVGKSSYIEKRKADVFLIINKIYFFAKSKCYNSKTDNLHTLNGYKIGAKEHQVVHC